MTENLNKRKLISNYVLKKPVQGYLYKQPGLLDEDLPWTLPAGTLVTVYETDYNWTVERRSNFLPGSNVNVYFKAILPKS